MTSSAFSQQKLTSDSVRIGEKIRSFQYYIPEAVSSDPALVFVLHASGGSPDRVRFFTNYEFERLAEEKKNFILVYPAGYKNYWNDCRVNA
jgi:polyhydroxybutyrate depolymerase